MTPQAAASELRSWVDYIIGWLYWIASTALVLVFISVVARIYKMPIPYLPALDPLPLALLAGFTWLLKRN